MRETSETHRRRTADSLPIVADRIGAERKAADERCREIRRWIVEDDEPAVRGID